MESKTSQKNRIRIRTCLGCGEKKSKYELVRLVWQEDRLEIDIHYIKSGRGAYCCRTLKCFKQLLKKRKRFIHAFRWPAKQTSEFLKNIDEVSRVADYFIRKSVT